MKDVYHICFTSHDEVLFRSKEDIGMFVNLLALKAYKTETIVMADAEMSTHVHLGVLCNAPKQFASRLKMSYAAYFNYKNHRHGQLGDKGTFILRVLGVNHIMVLLNYILRNGLHHGAAASATGYPFCSVREQFAQEIGFERPRAVLTSRNDINSFLPRHSDFPDSFQMDGNGVFLRQSFMETRFVEQYYTTPRNYLFQMNRLTGDDWAQQQEQDGTGRPLDISDVERGYRKEDLQRMLVNEKGRAFKSSAMTDLDVCELIDKQLLVPFGVKSIYQLGASACERIAKMLQYEFSIGKKQIGRCLALRRFE